MAIAEVISIGTELLLGQIVNTNSHFLAGELASSGIDSLYQVTVGDNVARIKSTFKQALDRADIVISTGGLGPTADDLTHESLAELFSVPMIYDAETEEKIRALFALRGLAMSDSNKKQANRPAGADILNNPRGTAPGIIWSVKEEDLRRAGVNNPERPRYILTFPGVPAEMKTMWRETAKPLLSQLFGPGVIWSVELKHYGISESAMAEKYAVLLDGVNPTVAPYAGNGESRLRVSAKAATADEAKKIVQPVVDQIKSSSGHLCYGQDDDTLESVVARLLTDKKLSLALAESCTGGLVSKRLTDCPGSSAFVKLNVVAYSNESKAKILHVSEQVLEKFGAVSRECAAEMSAGVRQLAESDIGLSITGVSGPSGGTDDKPVGLVFISLATKSDVYVAKRNFNPSLSRTEIRLRTASDALNMVRLYLLDPSLLPREYAAASTR